MKRVVLLLLVLLLLIDLGEDGGLGKGTFVAPQSSAKTSVTSSHHPDSAKTDFRHGLSFKDLPGSPAYGNVRPITLRSPLTLKIIHCCHLSSCGGLPL
jgi:hypothetical protein